MTTDFSTGNTAETVAEVYVYDRQNNTLQEVSVSDTGVPGNANSGGLSLQGNGSDWPTAISANGTYVVFQSSATNLVPGSGAGDQNSVSSVFNVSASNVYLYDTQTNTIQLISAGLNGAAANGASYSPQISADGDYVIFESTASNLVAGGSGGQAQTYIYDTQTGTIELVSAAADGLPADGESDYLSAISADGSVVAFGSSADNIVPTDTDGTANIFVADLNQTTSSPTPSGAIDVTADAAISDATLDGGTVTVASGVTLTLDNTTVSTTTIALNGTLDFTGPGTLDNVSLTGGKITVASGQLVTLDDVTLDNTTLTVDGGTTPSIKIDAGQWLVWAGTVTFGGPDAVIIDDNGHILHAGTLDVTFPMQTFEGSGTDTFNGNMGSGSDTIVNDGITFDGYGGFGGSITLINNTAGTIDADVSTAPFILDTSQTITNAGTLEATNGATLLIENGSIANTGTIEAAAESQVDLSDETISGGTLTGNGVFEITGSSTIGGNAVLSDGLVEIESGQTVTFGDATISGSAIEAVTVYSFTTVIDPSAGATGDYNFDSQNIAINNAGEIIGNYGDANGNYYGFVYSISSGTYTTVSDPLAVQGGSSGNGGTTVTGINDSGEVVGSYNSGSGDSAFVESGGEYTTLSQGAYALGINNSGEIVGVNYVGNNDSEGFLYSNGIYTNLNDGLAGVGGTYSFAINNSGQVLGDYYDANDDVHGFIYNSNGTYTDITDPLAAESASGAGVSGTHAEAFNNAGQVVGYYVDASGGVHGFIYSAGGYTTLNDPSAVNGTVAVGINDTGKVVGYYFDANGNTQVFTYSGGVYTDVNDPSSEGNGGLQALAINDAGQIVGTYDNGMLQGFLANPGQLAGALDITNNTTFLDTSLSGVTMTVANGVTLTLDNVVLDNVALKLNSDGATPSIQIDAGDTLTWAGASSFGPGTAGGASIIDNNGHIIHTGTLELSFSMSTFEGTGTVTENGGNTGVPSTLINESNTFDGYGQQGGGNPGSLTITNEAAGTYDADVAGHAFIWDAGASTITNQGVVEATNGGIFEIESTVHNDTTVVTNTGAGSVAAGAGSEVLLSSATIDGGTVSIAATGELVGSGTSAIDNATIDNSGSLETGGTFTLDDDTVDGGILTGAGGGGGNASFNIDAADTLTLNGVTAQGNTDGTGTVDNSGTIVLKNTLTLAGTGVTLLLDDTGTVSLNGATITGSNTGETLENNANTISGAGQIGNGNGDLTLQNDAAGTVTAQGGTLTIDAAVTSDGTMTAASGATLDLAGQVSGTGSTVIDAGGTAVVGALNSQAITYNGVGTLQITPTGNLTGAIGGLVQGDVIDFADNASITSTSISGSTLTVDESSGGPLSYTIGGAFAGEYFAIQSDGAGGDELVLSPTEINISLAVVGSNNPPVQVGQTLVATAAVTGDSSDTAATITYQWQALLNGTWTDVGGALAGNFDNGMPSSFLQLTQAELGEQFRAQASFIDDTGRVQTVTSAPTVAVAPVTPEITLPFSYAVESLTIVKNSTQIYDDSFSAAPPASPTILSSGTPTAVVFDTLGSVWTEGTSNGQPAAILSSTGVAPSAAGTGNADVIAFLNTNTASTNTTAGLKVGTAFTVSSTFALTALPKGSYGMQLNDGTSTHGADEVVSIEVQGFSNGTTVVELLQQNLVTDSSTTLASQTLTAAQLTADDQIEFSLVHGTGSQAITGSFELLDNGAVDTTHPNSSVTFATTGAIFTNGVNWTRADIFAATTPGVGVNYSAGQSAETGQTLTASASTNDPAATINYQWEESASSSFTTFTDIGTNSASYTVQASDLGNYIRVVASTYDPGNTSATETSVVTGAVAAAAPAGTAGQPINLGLTDQSGVGALTSVAIKGMPSGWSLNEGTNLGNGSWTVQTDDLAALTVLTASVYAGAALLEVTESWANPNGSTAVATIADNVEAYKPGSPIFAWSGDDTLTGAGGNDLFVFAQPIGNDTISNFNVATDQIDLVGFAGITSFGDLAGQIAGDGNGDTVITLGVGETITLHGVDAATLTAADFVFDQTPVLDNAGTMTVSDGAMLPLGGIIDNTGTIAVNSTGDDTDLQIVGDGVTLEGGGQVILSDSPDNMIVGTNADAALTNIDNTISGAGQIGDGDGNLTLVNETAGTIDANDANGVLTLDTGNTIVNAGLLEATHGGTLQIDDSVANSGTLAANGGTIVAAGDVAGTGDVAIGGGGAAEFAGTFDQNVTFTGPGVLELEHSQNYGGTVSGLATGDAIDLNDLAYSANESLTWTQGSDDGVLTVDDNGTTEHVRLDGNYIQSEFALTQDATAAAGTDVLSVPSVDATAVSGSSEVTGDISLAVINANDTFSANVTPDGSNYVGSFSLDPMTGSNGNVSVGFDFMADDDQLNLTPGQTLTQSYNVTVADAQNPAENVSQTVSVTVGGIGNNSFVFAPGVGADTITNFSPQQDTLELNNFVNAQTAQELQALITTDAHGDAVIDLGHNDSITLAGVTDAQLQQVIQAGHVLLH